jgi:predicted DsbA family dithiol-disulfide isomerase
VREVEVFHDFLSPWSFVAHERARKRWRDLGLRFAWLPWDAVAEADGRARPAAWQELGPEARAAFEGEALPFKPSKRLPAQAIALRGALWCQAKGGEAAAGNLRDGVFHRLYERGLDSHLDDAEVLAGMVERSGLDPIAFLDEMRAGAFAKELREHGARAEAAGARTVPSFVLGRDVLAGDQPLEALDAALRAWARA